MAFFAGINVGPIYRLTVFLKGRAEQGLGLQRVFAVLNLHTCFLIHPALTGRTDPLRLDSR